MQNAQEVIIKAARYQQVSSFSKFVYDTGDTIYFSPRLSLSLQLSLVPKSNDNIYSARLNLVVNCDRQI